MELKVFPGGGQSAGACGPRCGRSNAASAGTFERNKESQKHRKVLCHPRGRTAGPKKQEGVGPDILSIPRIVVVGVGGAGNNTVDRLLKIGIKGAETVAVNTDAQHLASIEADRKILIGHRLTGGRGTGGAPELGRKAAALARPTLEETASGADLVFVTAGLGGGTGTGAAPVMAEIARSQGGIVIGMVTTPFHVERSRILAAEGGLQALRPHVDTLIVIDNNRLMEIAPHLPLEQAFSVVDQLIAEIIKGITETITLPSLINLDYADVKTIMSCKGISYMVIGEGQIKDPMRVVRSAFCNPLMDVDPRGATGCLLHITGGPEMTLKDASMIASEMTSELDPAANVIWGARIRSDFGSRVRVMAIITGASSPEPFSKKADRCGDRQAEVAREIGGVRAAEARWT